MDKNTDEEVESKPQDLKEQIQNFIDRFLGREDVDKILESSKFNEIDIETIFNSIFRNITQNNKDVFNISFFSQLIYFYYFNNNVKVHFYSEFNNILKTSKINELDCFEKTFLSFII